MSGQVMEYWYLVCSAELSKLKIPFIMTASLICNHMMQNRYTDNPGTTVVIGDSKQFLFLIKSKWVTTKTIPTTPGGNCFAGGNCQGLIIL